MKILSVKNVGKAYRSYRSEWHRFARWFGLVFAQFDEKWVLKNIDFNIRSGESVGILGQNGAGKSTLLKIITGTSNLTEGYIESKGKISAILELGMGFNPELTGRQNARYTAGLMGYSVDEIDSKMPEIEAFADIGPYFDEPIRTYSSGMQMRVAFAVATAWRPDLLIIDEALSVGDAFFQSKCFKRISEFKTSGTSLLLVSHSVEDIVKHCDRAIFLQDGSVHSDGPSRTITNIYLDALFGAKEHRTLHRSSSNLQEKSSWALENKEDSFSSRPGYNKDEHRWGNGGASIIDYKIVSANGEFPARILSGDLTEFYFKVCFNGNFDSVVPGLLVKSLEGIFLFGTNSFFAEGLTSQVSAKEGDVKVFKFSMPLSLSENNYLISVGVSSGDPNHELIPLDRRYDSIIISVHAENKFSGIFDFQASYEEVV